MVKIFSYNVNGIRAALRKDFASWLKTNNADIVCLQEIKANLEQFDESVFTDLGYDCYWNSAEKKGYSGVAVYSKYKPEQFSSGFGDTFFDNEGRTIIVNFKEFILFNVYFPNGQRSDERLKYKLDFYNSILDKLIILKNNGHKIVICGDVNTAHKEIDLARPKENSNVSGFLPIEREWIDKLIDNNFIDTFRLFNEEPDNYTWWNMRTRARDRNVGWRIDYFFVTENLVNNVKSSSILSHVMGSDHCPIKLNLSF